MENFVAGDINHYNSPRTLGPLTPSVMMSRTPITTTKTIYSVGLMYSVALFTGFAQTRQVEIDEIDKNISEVKLKLTKEQIKKRWRLERRHR
jgi:outer membrane protein TolC